MERGLGHRRPHSSAAWGSFVPFGKLHCRRSLLTSLTHFSERGWGFSCHFREPHIQKLFNYFEYVQRKRVVATNFIDFSLNKIISVFSSSILLHFSSHAATSSSIRPHFFSPIFFIPQCVSILRFLSQYPRPFTPQTLLSVLFCSLLPITSGTPSLSFQRQ